MSTQESSQSTAANAAADESRFIALTERKRALEAELRVIGDELGTLEERLINTFSGRMQSSVTISGYTLYTQRDLQVSTGGNGAAVAEALREMGEGHMTTVNHQTLKAWLKETLSADGEWEADPRRLPDGLRGLIEVSERYSIRCRKA